MLTAMIKRRKRDEKLTYEVGKRLTSLVAGKRKEIAEAIGVSPSTMWDYMNGDILPGMEVLLRIAAHFGVTTDWLLRGEGSLIPKNAVERVRLEKLRRAETFGVAEDIDRYAEFLIEQKQHALPGMEHKAQIIYPDYLTSIGERLKYFRRVIIKETEAEFSKGLGITEKVLASFEGDKEVPDVRFLTTLASNYQGKINLDWLLTGRGEADPTPQGKVEGDAA